MEQSELTVNGRTVVAPRGASVAELLRQLDLRPQHVAVEVNCRLIPRQRHEETPIQAGDQIEIVTLVGGG